MGRGKGHGGAVAAEVQDGEMLLGVCPYENRVRSRNYKSLRFGKTWLNRAGVPVYELVPMFVKKAEYRRKNGLPAAGVSGRS